MTKKHFEMIAKVLNRRAKAIEFANAKDREKLFAVLELRKTMYNFADEFELVNSNFNRDTFFKACDIQPLLESLTEYIHEID